jgi:hypothetical protein
MQAHQPPGKMRMPHGTCARCTYGILDLPVHPLKHPIVLRVVSSEAAVSMCLMPWLEQEPVHKAEVNCAPLSDVTVAGTPKCAFQLVMKVSVHMLASMLCRGTASTYLVDLLMMVNRYTWPSEGLPGELVCGPRDGVERSCRLLVELSTQSQHMAAKTLSTPFHTKCAVTMQLVARMPGWATL